MVRLLFLFSLCFCFLDSFSQSYDFRFRHITSKEGLPYPDVRCIVKDKEGYVWIGTAGGLFRFDGSRFDAFKNDEGDSTSISSNVIYCLFDDGDKLYCGTKMKLSVLDKASGKFQNYSYPSYPGLQTYNAARNIFKGDDGYYWMLCLKGMARFDDKTKKITTLYHDKNSPASLSSDVTTYPPLTKDKIRNGFWIPTHSGLNFYSYEEKKFYNYRYNPKHWKIFDDRKYQAVLSLGNMFCLFTYASSDTAILVHDFETGKSEPYGIDLLPNADRSWIDLTGIAMDSTGNVFYGTWQIGTHVFNIYTKESVYLKPDSRNPTALFNTFVQNVYLDDEQNLWLGCLDGISMTNRVSKKIRVHYPTTRIQNDTNFYGSSIYDMMEDSDTNLWIGNDGFGTWKLDHRTKKFSNYLSPVKEAGHDNVFTFAENDTNLFIGVRRGLKSLNKITGKVTTFAAISTTEKFAGYTVFKAYIDSKKRLWISCVVDGNYLYDLKTGRKKHFPFAKDDSVYTIPQLVTQFYEDNAGTVYLLSNSGVGRYNEADSTFTIQKAKEIIPGLKNQLQIKKMFYDSHGLLWIITHDGVVAWLDKKTGAHEIYDEAHGLISSVLNDIAEDHRSNVWIGTNIGMMRWIRSENKLEKISFRSGQIVNDFSRIVPSKSGKLFVSNFNSILEIDPDLVDDGEKLRNILVSRLTIFDKPKSFTGDSVSLLYRENFFTINYSAPENVFIDDIEYRYKLVNFDKDWVEAGNHTSAGYTNVPGGEYDFIVQARTGKQPWGQVEKKLHISVSKIYYQTWWFRFLVAITMFFMIRLYVRFRKSQQAKKEAEHAIGYFANSAYANNSPDEILWDLARNCISRLEFVDCVIYLLDEERNILVQKAALGNKTLDEKTILNPIEIPMGKGIVGSVAVSGKTEIIPDTTKDPRYIKDDVVGLSEIAVPVLNEGKVIGVIDSEHPKRDFFTPEHKRILETIASICAAKIANAQSSEELANKEKKLLEIDKRMAEVKLMALRAQMNPHFIFNCLNSIDNYIITQDTLTASRYLNKFARLIRLILNASDKTVNTLDKEKEMLNYYLELESLRFEDKFTYSITSNDDGFASEIEMPSMLIQPFVENAILHGVMNRKESGGKIMVDFNLSGETLFCTITDNGIGREKAMEIKKSKTAGHESKGMQVTEDRIEILQQQAQQYSKINITDLKDENGIACGTKVEIAIPVVLEYQD